MLREFSLEGLTIYYQGERWVAVSDTGVEATSERPFPSQGLDEETQAWAASMQHQIASRLAAQAGVPFQGQAPPEARELMSAWGFGL